jgi:hypothetical protein
MPEFRLTAMAVLAAIPVAGEEERVGDLTAEAAGNVDELDETDDGGFGEGEAFTSDEISGIRLDDFRLPLDDQTKGATQRYHCQRLERGVQRQTPHVFSPKSFSVVGPLTQPG